MGTIYHCLKKDNRYSPPCLTLVYEAPTERDAIEWLEKNGGGVYKNILHNLSFVVLPKTKT